MKKTFSRVLQQRRGSLALFLDRNWPPRCRTLQPPTRNFLGKAHLVLARPGPMQSKALALPCSSQTVYTPKSLPKMGLCTRIHVRHSGETGLLGPDSWANLETLPSPLPKPSLG